MALTDFFRGIAFPFQQSATALPAPVSDDELVKQSLMQILQTEPSERVMRPNFGCNLQAYVFENNDDLLAQLLRAEIASAIARYEPRAALQDVSFQRSDTTVIITVTYAVISTRTLDQLNIAVSAAGPR